MKQIIVGIDEAGRGPLAGPVIAAAFVILNTRYQIRNTGVRDSKALSAKQRERIYTELLSNPGVEWGIGQVSEKQIDRINIYQATRLAMKKAVLSLERNLYRYNTLSKVPNWSGRSNLGLSRILIHSLIIDGNMLLDLPIKQKAIVKADVTVLQCMAASIVAKVTRDRLMQKLHKKYPLYGFDRHKGYGTAYHLEMLKIHGPSPIHRLSFAPCK